MCGTSETKTTTNTKSSKRGYQNQQLQLPGYVNDASQTAVGLATQQATSPVEGYTGPLVQGLSADEQAAMQALRDYNPTSQTPAALENLNLSQGLPTMERIVDETGRLGAIADYFNPYVQQTLNPTLSAISDAWQQANKRVGMLSAYGGGFGDARHGIMEAENASNAAGQVEDATYKAYYDAWNQAMGGRLSDINRFTNQEQDYFRRLLEGSKTAMNIGAMDQQQQLQLLRERLNAGATQRQVDQAGLTANYGEWLRQQEEEQRRIQQLAQVNATTPHEKEQNMQYAEKSKTNSVQTMEQPDNSGLSLAGSLLSAAMAPMSGGTSLAGSLLGGALGGAAQPQSASWGQAGTPYATASNPYNLPWLA